MCDTSSPEPPRSRSHVPWRTRQSSLDCHISGSRMDQQEGAHRHALSDDRALSLSSLKKVWRQSISSSPLRDVYRAPRETTTSKDNARALYLATNTNCLSVHASRYAWHTGPANNRREHRAKSRKYHDGTGRDQEESMTMTTTAQKKTKKRTATRWSTSSARPVQLVLPPRPSSSALCSIGFLVVGPGVPP